MASSLAIHADGQTCARSHSAATAREFPECDGDTSLAGLVRRVQVADDGLDCALGRCCIVADVVTVENAD